MSNFAALNRKLILKVVLLTAAVIVVGLVGVISLVGISSSRGVSSDRKKVELAYRQVRIPAEFRFKQRVDAGDGFDSQAGYEYDYETGKSQVLTLRTMQAALEKEGFKQDQDSSIDQGILLVSNQALKLSLDIEYQATNNMSIIARSLK